MPKAYYNELDPKAAAWLRELIKQGYIASGDVDERSLEDVYPKDLSGYTQCHFFAGIGTWSYALRNAGWADDRPVWTGSCPCQPFSSAGKGAGFADERHLWPAWHWLIQQCRPSVVFGEQVATKIGLAWFDLVSADLEGSGYTVGAANLPACGVGAPHLRQRQWWVAESATADSLRAGRTSWGSGAGGRPIASSSCLSGVGQADAYGDAARRNDRGISGEEAQSIRSERSEDYRLGDDGQHSGVALGDSLLEGLERAAGEELRGKESAEGRHAVGVAQGDSHEPRPQGRSIKRNSPDEQSARTPGLVNGFWANAEWLPCRDGKARAVEPGTFPLVDGTPGRVGLLRGYGNAINAEAAKAFIEAYLETKSG